jgi:ATP-dependent DNA helicase HFM1/MER3
LGAFNRHQTPIVQGIQIVPATELPDRFRSIFPFPLFNAIQSKCFDTAFRSDDNLVLAAPTGGGKTAVLELAICRLLSQDPSNQYKIIYQAPTKSLCAERQRDWQSKFGAMDLQCAELTGDTDQAQLWNVQNARIIITTPEKWDSMTRKWKDHVKLMQMIRLFLIDEVHMLKETRGATLEAVVSRMKSVGSDVRFIALSATVPNFADVAAWLGRDTYRPHLPARHEKFGEEFRPVKLQKFVYGYQCGGNDFCLDNTCEVRSVYFSWTRSECVVLNNSRLPGVIAKHSSNKPIMIFCCTRNSAIRTAKNLGKLWATNSQGRHWPAPTQRLSLRDKVLQGTFVLCDTATRHMLTQGKTARWPALHSTMLVLTGATDIPLRRLTWRAI